MAECSLKCWFVLRCLCSTAAAVAGVCSLVLASQALLPLPPGLSWPAALASCALGLAAYVRELRRTCAWAAAKAAFAGGGAFDAYSAELRGATPLIDLEMPGSAPVPYPLAEWRDETRWVDFGFDVKRGLVLASFPLEFIPGDHSEASALEFAKQRVADEGAGKESDKLHTPVDLRLRLRMPSGSEVEAPEPRLLDAGPCWARPPCPVFMLLSCLCLMGLLLELVILCVADPVEWPIRKTFYTVQGGKLGSLTYSCSSAGDVEIDGALEELRAANKFWIGNDEHWRLVETEIAALAPKLLALRRARLAGQVAATAAAAVGMLALFTAGDQTAVPLAAGALSTATLWALACLADRAAQQRLLACSERLGSSLPGGATVTASWGGGSWLSSSEPASELSIEVEQVKPVGVGRELPVLKSVTASATNPWLS